MAIVTIKEDCPVPAAAAAGGGKGKGGGGRKGGNGGKQFQQSRETPSGMKRTIYDYPPPGTLDPKSPDPK